MKKLVKLSVFIVGILILASCSDILREHPKSELNQDNFFTRSDDVELGLRGMYENWGIYTQFYGGQTTMRLLHPDDLMASGNYIPTYNRYTFTAESFGPHTWDFYYDIINRANYVIQGVENADNLSEDERNVALGEARAIRAFGYFHLVQAFGGNIPLTLEPATSLQDIYQGPSTADAIYGQIIDDLNYAGQNAPSRFSEDQSIRINRWTAKAFLAYTHLVRNNWQEALDQTNDIIQNGGFELFQNPEVLWDIENNEGSEFMMTVPGDASLNTLHIYQRAKPDAHPDGGWSNFHVNKEVIDIFEEGDMRLEEHLYLYVVDANNDTIWYTDDNFNTFDDNPNIGKWKDIGADHVGTVNTSNNYPLMRYANVFLMKAEALNEINNGPNSEAYEAINIIRRRGFNEPLFDRSSTADLAPNLSKQQFLDAVFEERARELIGEAPWRLFDIRRRDLVLENVRNEGFNIQERHKLFPIPQNEIDRNPELEQNPGY